MLIMACGTSSPYVTKTTINETANKRIETICTHKTIFIPWYVGFAAGVIATKYDVLCEDKTSSLDEESYQSKCAKQASRDQQDLIEERQKERDRESRM